MGKKRRYIIQDLCDGCDGKYLCVRDCVTSFLEIEKTAQGNRVVFKDRGYCINCGHCNSICPKKAIKIEDEKEFDEENDFIRFLASKRTVRKYNKKEISDNDLELILTAAQTAPSEKNRPTVRICMIKEKLPDIFTKAIEVLNANVEKVGHMHPQYQYIKDLFIKKTPIFWGAEYAVVIVGRQQYTVDAALVAERMQLMASSLNISSGYNGNLKFAINNCDELRQILSISDNEEALVSFALGHSDLEYKSPYIGSKRKIIFY